MKSITHGGDIYSYEDKFDKIIDFSSNINPLGIPESVKTALHNAVEKSIFYPDPLCRKLSNQLSKYYNLPSSYFAIGNGAADIIFKIAQVIKPKTALLLAPTFSEYESSLNTVNCNIKYYNLLEKNNFQIKNDYLDYLTSEIDIIYICNPNNPTGNLTEKDLLINIIDKCKKENITVVIDECFNEFIENSAAYTLINELKKYENLVILNAFTKMYAIPGVRLGYCMSSNSNLISKIEEWGQAWSVSVFAQEAGISALTEVDFVKSTVKYISTERSFLKNELNKIGFTVYNSKANYIFFKNNFNSDLEKSLKKEGILIRNCKNYHNLDKNFYRIAVKSHNDNIFLVEALKRILK